MRARVSSGLRFFLGIGVMGLLLAGCGGGGGGSTTGPSASGTVRIDGRVASASTAQAPGSLLARVWALLGWSRAAEAQAAGCTVSAPGAAAVTTDGQGRFVLVNVPTTNGSVTITFSCPGGASGSLTLDNLPPGAEVNIEVDIRPGRIEVRTRNIDLNPSPPSPSPSISPAGVSPSPSPVSPPSPPSPSLKPRG